MNFRNVFEVLVGIVAIGTFCYVFFLEESLLKGEENPISVVEIISPETFNGSGDFTFVFHKNRDDCKNPSTFRTFVNVASGKPTTVKDALDMHIQYPVNTGEEPHRLVVPIVAPVIDPPPGKTFMVTEICYTCSGDRVCKPWTSPTFEVLP